MTENQELLARQLLEGVFVSFKDKFDCKELTLPRTAMSEIANDSDYHRTKVGYTSYELVLILTIEKKEWAIAFGYACGSYPADPYNCDIAAVSISSDGKSDEVLAVEINNALVHSSYFCNSLIYARADGNLAVGENGKFSQKVSELLKPKIQEFIAQDLETDPELYHLDLRPVVTSAVQYKPECTDFLFEKFCTVLAA